MTEDQTWTECVRMWEWICGEVGGGEFSIFGLKDTWLKTNGYSNVAGGCFFCDSARRASQPTVCGNCPGRKYDEGFSCTDDAYNFNTTPHAFLAKIKELNKIRLEQK